MKFFGWMQNKLSGKQGNKPNTVLSSHHLKQEPREEFSDWPHGLLAIGTFGRTNSSLNREETREIQAIQEEPSNAHEEDQDRTDPSSPDDLEDFNPEDVGKLQKELTRLLTRTKKRKSDAHKELTTNLPLDRFLNCPSSLEVDRRISNALCTTDCGDEKEEDIERTISAILGRCKEISTENKKKKKKDIGKASVSFLFKKIFVCANGFSPKPSLRDTLQESRMEKLLRMMLHKKINTQGSSRTPSMKKYLQDKQQLPKKSDVEETQERNSDGYKWVKTDSDFIVLEI